MSSRPNRPLRKFLGNHQPVPDWSKLARNDDVTVLLPNGTTAKGRVDMIARDRSVFWLVQDNGLGRLMVFAGDQCRVSKTPRRLPRATRYIRA